MTNTLPCENIKRKVTDFHSNRCNKGDNMKSFVLRYVLHFGFAATILIVAILLWTNDKAGNMDKVNEFTAGVGASWSNYAVTLAAVGVLAMALLEAIKGICDVRRWFHAWKLGQWIGKRSAYEELLFLAIGDRERTDALCAQPLEKMMGQIQAAANVALDFPEDSRELYRFLTTTDVLQTPGKPDAASALAPEDRAKNDREHWAKIANMEGQRSLEAGGAGPTGEELKAARARIRLANLVSRKLDAFQLRTQYYWERANQLASMLISVLIVWYALGFGTATFTLHSLAFGIIAGLLSPFAKDLATSLTQFAKK